MAACIARLGAVDGNGASLGAPSYSPEFLEAVLAWRLPKNHMPRSCGHAPPSDCLAVSDVSLLVRGYDRARIVDLHIYWSLTRSETS